MLLTVVSCAALWPVVVEGGDRSLAPRVQVLPAPEDSLTVRVSWQASRAQRGASVDHYVWALEVDGASVAAGETAELSVSTIIARPLPGDSATIQAFVHAVDSRGIAGEVAQSPALTYYEPVAGPTPPVVDIDTVAINDLSVLDCGDTWCDVAWSGVEGVDAYAVFALETEPVELLDSIDVAMALAQLGGVVPDTAMWEVTSGLQLAGHLGMIVVRAGTCAWPVLASDSAMRCRVEGLRPARRYQWVVRPAQLTE